MRLLICAGGTGGGIYPALAVLEALNEDGSRLQLSTLWVGGIGGMEADLVKRAGIPFEAIPAAGVHGVGPRALPGNLLQLGRGVLAARQVLRRFHPDVLFFTGGYVAVPVAVAGWNIPAALYVPDIEPGLALKTLARFSRRIAVTTDDSRAYFPGNPHVITTGYPTRPGLKTWERGKARRALGLLEDLPVLLVMGGSKGARSINQALLAVLPSLLPEMQVLHLSGQLDWPEVQAEQARLPQDLSTRYHPFPYLHEEMGAALSAADLAVARAGASTLGELPLFGLPAVLVPYPYAWRYQQVNASYLARHGAAILLTDEELPARLTGTVQGIMSDPARREAMGRSMRSLASPAAAGRIADLLVSLARPGHQEGENHG